jgi:hypothetical protein
MPVDATTCVAEVSGAERRTGGEGYPCPVCGGSLVPTRAAWRCRRCSFTLCAGCEPGLTCGEGAAGEG